MIYQMEIKGINIHAYLISDLLSWRRKFFSLKEGFLDDQSRRSLRVPW
jgi:hypothetical protein